MIDNSKLRVCYPGVYTEAEQAAIDRYKRGECEAAIPAAVSKISTDPWVMQLYARCWDRWNPLFNDPEYAKNTVWGNLPAVPGYVTMETRSSIPEELGAQMRPDGTTYIGDGYDHEDLYFKPVFPGDTLTAKNTGWDIIDITDPEGSIKRRMIFIDECEVYNQNGELVAKSIRRWPETLRISDDPETMDALWGEAPGDVAAKHGKSDKAPGAMPKQPPKGAGGPGGPGGEGPDGEKKAPPPMMGLNNRHKAHKMTKEDYDIFVDIWKNEKIRGADTLYWEDVNIGDEPQPIASPPQYDREIFRTMAAWQIMKDTNGLKEVLSGTGGDPHFFPYNEETGLYGGGDGHIGTGGGIAYLYNFHAKLLGTRLITNWCGDEGFVTKLGWRFVNDAPKEEQFNHFPEGFYRPTELLKVPYMKDRYANIHGYGDDAFITRGYVYDKYVGEDGGHYVDLICWCEDLDGNIGQEIPATVKLPSRGDK
ncbi:MAG: hypothetical protein E7430_06975 [Ruminococcaceae bacterium]|nr:hypothetical protein [Oscillospiraceae bacterium]